MKKLLFVLAMMLLAVTPAVFMNSCGLIDDAKECESNLDISFELKPWVTVLENDTEASGYNVTFQAVKWKCNGVFTAMGVNTYMTNEAGGAYDIEYGFNLHNNNDYVTVEVICSGKYDFQEAEPQTYTYTYDSNNTKDGDYIKPYVVFNYVVE